MSNPFLDDNPKLQGLFGGRLSSLIDQFNDDGSNGTAFGIRCIINMIIFAVCAVLSMGVLAKSWATLRGGGRDLPQERVGRI
jgi:hypothetical protein